MLQKRHLKENYDAKNVPCLPVKREKSVMKQSKFVLVVVVLILKINKVKTSWTGQNWKLVKCSNCACKNELFLEFISFFWGQFKFSKIFYDKFE